MPESRSFREVGNIGAWLEQTGIDTAEGGFRKPPKFPYQAYFAITTDVGPDARPGMLISHKVHVEQYQETKDRSHEARLMALLRQEEVEVTYDREWLGSESMFVASFDFTLIKKTRKEE